MVFAHASLVALHRGQEDVEAALEEVVFERRHLAQVFPVADEVDAGAGRRRSRRAAARGLRLVADPLLDVLLEFFEAGLQDLYVAVAVEAEAEVVDELRAAARRAAQDPRASR